MVFMTLGQVCPNSLPTSDPMYPIVGEVLWQWREQACEQAITAGIDPIEVDWLLRTWTNLDSLQIRLGLFRTTTIAAAIAFADMQTQWQRRLVERVPVQYLTGVAPWREFTLMVSPSVLIPRPETECLIDLAVQAVTAKPELATGTWVDLGTGSGAIALGLAKALPSATIHAVDTSLEALQIAQTNGDRYGLPIHWHHGSWLTPLHSLKGRLSGIVSNPPYIPQALIPGLQPEVERHEPHLALDGGKDGLDAVRYLVESAPLYLQTDGLWLVELMAGQADEVAHLLAANGCYREIQIHPDLAGIPRFVAAYRN